MRRYAFVWVLMMVVLMAACVPIQPEMEQPTVANPTESAGEPAEAAEADAIAVPEMPETLMVADGEEVALSIFAEGVQIYQCKPNQNDATKFEWTFVAPEAILYDEAEAELGTHFAGPTWQANDGSKVVGEVKARADAPEAGAIPWLLLNAKSVEGEGLFGAVTSIQRVETTGGIAPQEGCDADHQDEEARVPYTATYLFYKAAAN